MAENGRKKQTWCSQLSGSRTGAKRSEVTQYGGQPSRAEFKAKQADIPVKREEAWMGESLESSWLFLRVVETIFLKL